MDFKNYLEVIKPTVDDRIIELVEHNVDDELLQLLKGGKRLRAGLLQLIYENLTPDPFNRKQTAAVALDLAAAIEISHTASLIVDDMIDGDTERRGQPTLHVSHGYKNTMLAAVGLLSLPYDIVSEYSKLYVKQLASTQRGMVSGALKELFAGKPDLPATKIYDIVISHKTGKLFSLAARWGAMAAFADDATVKTFEEYGMRVGKVMQISDDIADLKEIVDGGKMDNFGSEMLLLRCVCLDGALKELMSDVKSKSLDLRKVKQLWGTEGIQKALSRKVENEIRRCEEMAPCEGMLKRVPREISEIMLSEAEGAAQTPDL